MSEGKIEVTFEGLCAFFTKHLPQHGVSMPEPRMMVGLIGVWGANDATHVPTLTIAEEGIAETVVYSGNHCRRGLMGDVYLHLMSANGLAAGDIHMEGVNLLDIENLYNRADLPIDPPPAGFAIDPQKCQTRLHFRNGMLAQMTFTEVFFRDVDGTRISPPGTSEKYTYNVMLEIPIPENFFPVLHFDGETDDFIFKANRKYIITITSLPQSVKHHQMQKNHFQYFYELAGNNPAKIVVPEEANPGDEGRPHCMHGGFGGPEY